jgi:hypothetical protein
MRHIKKQRVDIMAVLKNHELRIMSLEKMLYHLIQAISTSVQAQKVSEPSCPFIGCTGEPGHQHESGSAANTESASLQLESEH